MGINIDEVAPPTSGNAWKPAVGETVKGIITYIGKFRGRSYDNTKLEDKLRIDLDVNGDTVTIFATTNNNVNGDGYAKRDAKAISDAVRAANCSTIEVGGSLGIKRVEDVDTPGGAAHSYQAQYKAPAAKVELDTSPVSASASPEPATAAVDDLLG